MNGRFDADRPSQPAQRPIDIRLIVEPGDLIHGWIEPVEARRIRFHGWMDLIAAINRLRSR